MPGCIAACSESPQAQTDTDRQRRTGNSLSDAEVLAKAGQASNGEAFEKLWAGDASGFASRSEAALALCSHIAFWTGGNPGSVDKLFRQSGLYRPKWDERHYGDGRTYGQATIQKALEDATEFYAAADDEWEDPVPLPEGLPPVATLDPTMQIPPDFAAAGAVVVAGSLIGRKLGILPKRQDDWLVVPNLWGAVVGRPSLLKSPALAEVMKPLARLVAEAYEEYQKAMLAFEPGRVADTMILSQLLHAGSKVEPLKRGQTSHSLDAVVERELKLYGSDSLVAQ